MKAIPIPIAPTRLQDLYSAQKMTDQEIVDLLLREGHAATLKRVRSWRKRFNIETVPRWSRHDVPSVEGRLRSILVGSMLGDGRLVHRTNATHYEESHCGEQLPYLEWKAREWGEAWVRDLREVPDKRGFKQYRMWTHAHESLNEWQALFYAQRERGWKRLMPEIVDMVDDLALAIWYLDDGFAGWWPLITFGSTEDARHVALQIFERFDLRPRWHLDKGQTGRFIFEREDTAHRFLDIIRPHVPECMSYKLEGFGFMGAHYQVREKMDVEKLRLMATQGVPIRRMASELGVGASTVSRHLDLHEIAHARIKGNPKHREACEKAAKLDQVRVLAAEGVSIQEISRRVGKGASTISRWLTKNGIEHPRKVGRPEK